MNELRRIDVEHKEICCQYPRYILDSVEKLNRLRETLKRFNVIGFDNDHEEHYGNISARVDDSNKFICSATQTGGIDEINEMHYPTITGFLSGVLYSIGVSNRKPSVEATTHLGFYEGNHLINCVAHGHYSPFYEYYKNREKVAIVLEENIKFGTFEMKEAARQKGLDERMLKNKSDYGNWGIVIPKGHFNAFFLVGESVKAVEHGFLTAINEVAIGLVNKVNIRLTDLDSRAITEDSFRDPSQKAYLP